ncbi:hypothetical protein ES705_24179 [subsurface metagenome]
MRNYSGAWMTDIDDTLIKSGEMPTDQWIEGLVRFLRVMKKNNIVWIPMSGVAIAKLGPRIVYRLPEDVLTHVIYYGGDGSLRYFYNEETKQWDDDPDSRRLFSDAQAVAVLGRESFVSSMAEIYGTANFQDPRILERLAKAQEELREKGLSTEKGILDELKEELKRCGFDPAKSETYFRGGSTSWMMLGDSSAEPYRAPEAVAVRKKLIELAKKLLCERDFLCYNKTDIDIPFPGARGIKFVLKGNDKERATRHLLANFGLKPEQVLFVGNELFDGGNDNMIRNIDGISLLSVGEREDPGENLIHGNVEINGRRYIEDAANRLWMDWVMQNLENGKPWAEILREIRTKSAAELLS